MSSEVIKIPKLPKFDTEPISSKGFRLANLLTNKYVKELENDPNFVVPILLDDVERKKYIKNAARRKSRIIHYSRKSSNPSC